MKDKSVAVGFMLLRETWKALDHGPWIMKTLVHTPALPLLADLTKDLISKPPFLL